MIEFFGARYIPCNASLRLSCRIMTETNCISSLKFKLVWDIMGIVSSKRRAQPPPGRSPSRSQRRTVNLFRVVSCASLIFSGFHQVSLMKIISNDCDSQRRIKLSYLEDRQDRALKRIHLYVFCLLQVRLFIDALDDLAISTELGGRQ